MFVDDPAGFAEAARMLAATPGPLAVDVERASGIRYDERAFLVQIRAATGPAVLADPETAGGTLGALAPLLSERTALFHAASQDLPSLRALGVEPPALIDTEVAARLMGCERVNLGALVSDFLGISLAKAHSAADWSTRPLPEAWLDYAVYDVWFLHELAEALLSQLDESGRREWFDAECAHLLAAPVVTRAEPWRRLSGLSTLRDPRAIARARALWTERDAIARERDVAPKRLLPDAAVVEAARTDPRDAASLLAIDGFSGPSRSRLAGRYLSALEGARRLPRGELPDRRGPRPAHPPHASWKRSEPEAADLLARARETLDAQADALGVEPGLLLRPSTLRLWVWTASREGAPGERGDAALLEETLTGDDARRWQIDLVGPRLLAAVAGFRAAAAEAGTDGPRPSRRGRRPRS